MQALFERMGVPSTMMDVYMMQSKKLSTEFLAKLNEDSTGDKKELVKLGFNSITAHRMIVESKKLKGKNICRQLM